MQLVPLTHVSQRTPRAPTPDGPRLERRLLVHASQVSRLGTAHKGRPWSVIRYRPLMPGGGFGHSVACGVVLTHEASSIVQPNALRGSAVHFLWRLLQGPEQQSGDWVQWAPGWRQAIAATPGTRAVSQNPKTNAATDAAAVPAGRRR
jgi:hypothetical protein